MSKSAKSLALPTLGALYHGSMQSWLQQVTPAAHLGELRLKAEARGLMNLAGHSSVSGLCLEKE